jgi:hypothetical protein
MRQPPIITCFQHADNTESEGTDPEYYSAASAGEELSSPQTQHRDDVPLRGTKVVKGPDIAVIDERSATGAHTSRSVSTSASTYTFSADGVVSADAVAPSLAATDTASESGAVATAAAGGANGRANGAHSRSGRLTTGQSAMILAAGIGIFEDRLRAADAVAAELVAEEEQIKKKKADKEAKKKRKKKASSRKQANLPAPSATVESLGEIVRKLEAENAQLLHANMDSADRVQSLEQTAKSLEQKLALVGANDALFSFHFACTRSD